MSLSNVRIGPAAKRPAPDPSVRGLIYIAEDTGEISFITDEEQVDAVSTVQLDEALAEVSSSPASLLQAAAPAEILGFSSAQTFTPVGTPLQVIIPEDTIDRIWTITALGGAFVATYSADFTLGLRVQVDCSELNGGSRTTEIQFPTVQQSANSFVASAGNLPMTFSFLREAGEPDLTVVAFEEAGTFHPFAELPIATPPTILRLPSSLRLDAVGVPA